MPDRPYTLLSCSVSLDGYLGDQTPRLALSNDADFDRVDEVRASCDAIMVGAVTVRTDNPRLLVRSQARRDERTARGLPPSPMKITVTERVDLDARSNFFTAGEAEKLVYTSSPRVPDARARLGPVATIVDGGRRVRMRRLSEDLGRPRRGAADGRGRRHRAHPVPGRRPRRRAAARRRAVLRRRLERPALRERRALPVERAAGARSSPRCARSATWCCCATRSRPGSRTNERDAMRASRTGPATGLIAQVAAARPSWRRPPGSARRAGSPAFACAVDHGGGARARLGRGERLGPASWVTLARATLAVGVAALAADSFAHDTPVALLVTLAAVALALDAGRRLGGAAHRTATALGARFDGEVDAFLILALSVYVAPRVRRVGARDRRRALRCSSPASGCCRGCARRCRRAAGAGSSRRRRASC